MRTTQRQNLLVFFVGDSSPAVSFLVRGYETNPTSMTATYSFVGWLDGEEVDAGAATVSGVSSYADVDGVTKWQFVVSCPPYTQEAGIYGVRFSTSLSGEVSSIPARFALVFVNDVATPEP